MSDLALPYLPPTHPVPEIPLGRYLPPFQSGYFPKRLEQSMPGGSWLIDPLCSTPLLPIELATAGYRILVASNNPVISLLLEVLSSAPSRDDFQSALSELMDSRRGSDRLEMILSSLYITECHNCGQDVQAHVFLWKRGADRPHATLLQCPSCGFEGEQSVTSKDLAKFEILGNPRLHISRASERVNIDGKIGEAAEEAISMYGPRALFFLFTLSNKIEGLHLPLPKKRLLYALLISLCDEGNMLWPHPPARLRYKQIQIPNQYRENNLWLGLERAIRMWSKKVDQVNLTYWPELPSEKGGICLFPGRIRSLLPLPPSIHPEAIVTVIPRPNQAFWTLSAVWSGWLWGKDALQPLKVALERRRYDWNWHLTALYSALNILFKQIPENTPMHALITEVSPGFMAATLIAAEASGFQISGLALRDEQETTQVSWQGPSKMESLSSIRAECEKAILSYLAETNEPGHYLKLFSACLLELSGKQIFKVKNNRFDEELIPSIIDNVSHTLNNKNLIQRFESSSQNMEIGSYWLVNPPKNLQLPLIDQIENEIVFYLQENYETTFHDMELYLCHRYQGLLTPSRNLILAVLSSYAEPVSGQSLKWHIRSQDVESARISDLTEITKLLTQMAVNMGYSSQGHFPITWSLDGEISYEFYPISTSMISQYILGKNLAVSHHRVFVIPGSRSNLILYKLRRDPRLADAVKGTHFIKYRYLRQLAERTDLQPSTWKSLLDNDPPEWEEITQMSIFR